MKALFFALPGLAIVALAFIYIQAVSNAAESRMVAAFNAAHAESSK